MLTQVVTENITLRPAIAEDVDWVAPLLFSAGPALFSYIFAAPPDQAQEILSQAFTYPYHAFSYEHTQVVEVNREPAGMMISYAGVRKRQADEKVHAVMARILPLLKLPKILVNLADLTRIKQDVAPQDYYILGLSILPALRNQGLGSHLLNQAELQAQAQNCQSLCLDVTYSNAKAKALFERSGFQVTCSKTTSRFEQMTRAGGIHRLEKPLAVARLPR
jgi:ribosomal protein S18 acetylase RimI-like enzyme